MRVHCGAWRRSGLANCAATGPSAPVGLKGSHGQTSPRSASFATGGGPARAEWKNRAKGRLREWRDQ
jgi:hypothetical protein